MLHPVLVVVTVSVWGRVGGQGFDALLGLTVSVSFWPGKQISDEQEGYPRILSMTTQLPLPGRTE